MYIDTHIHTHYGLAARRAAYKRDAGAWAWAWAAGVDEDGYGRAGK
jgi:hypothetical protein